MWGLSVVPDPVSAAVFLLADRRADIMDAALRCAVVARVMCAWSLCACAALRESVCDRDEKAAALRRCRPGVTLVTDLGTHSRY